MWCYEHFPPLAPRWRGEEVFHFPYVARWKVAHTHHKTQRSILAFRHELDLLTTNQVSTQYFNFSAWFVFPFVNYYLSSIVLYAGQVTLMDSLGFGGGGYLGLNLCLGLVSLESRVGGPWWGYHIPQREVLVPSRGRSRGLCGPILTSSGDRHWGRDWERETGIEASMFLDWAKNYSEWWATQTCRPLGGPIEAQVSLFILYFFEKHLFFVFYFSFNFNFWLCLTFNR